MPDNLLILVAGGLFSGVLAGFLGIGGGTVLVPILVALGYTPVQAVATSSLAIVITSISGSVQNFRMGVLDLKKVFALGLPSVITAQLGVYIASNVASYILLAAFGVLLWLNIYLVELRKQIVARKQREEAARILADPENPSHPEEKPVNPTIARIATGGIAGVLAGLFGIGGGVIMVPMQMLLLGETIKVAIQTSLGVIMITALSAASGHYFAGNVLFLEGLILGSGGLVGAQISTRFLPKLPDQVISFAFRALLALLSVNVFWQAWASFNAR
jgi:uncharacterized membrane protein YfcA